MSTGDFFVMKKGTKHRVSSEEECKKNNITTLSSFPKDNLSSILNISAYGITKEKLKSEGIIAQSNGEKITIGIHYYNTKEDILKLISVIKKHQRI